MAEIKIQIATLLDSSKKIVKLLTNTKKCARAKITKGYMETRLEMLNEYWSTYSKQYDGIVCTYSKEDFKSQNFEPEKNYDATEEACLDLKTLIKDWLYDQESTSAQCDNNSGDISTFANSRPRLPPIPLPKFSGDYNDWISFRDLYISLIHNDNSLSKIEKHHYLKSSLTGEAEQLLKNFTLTEANYLDAWKKIEERYDNKRVIVNNILNRFLNQKKLHSESAKGVKELLDTTSQCLDSLKNLKIDISNWDAIIVHIVVGKLDTDSHKFWEQSLGNSTAISSFGELAAFLENRFRTLEMINTTQVKEITQRKPYPTAQKPINVKSFATEVNSTCTYCSQNHYICHCKEFALISVPERQTFVKGNNICFNCLVKGHSVSHCRQSTTCKKCGRRHHTLLHNTNPNKPDKSMETEKPVESTSTSCNIASMKIESNNDQVILATALVEIEAKNGSTCTLRALIDQGSQASFVTEAAAQFLNLDRTPVNGKITGISNSSVVSTTSMVKLTIHNTQTSTSQFEVHAYVLRKLTSLLPSREIPQSTWPSSLQLDLADPEFHKPGSIDILLGADVYAHIILEGLHKHDSLVALNSCLGWLISGKVSQIDTPKHNFIVTHAKMEVDQLLRQFWELEENLSHKKPMSMLEKQCEEHFKNTHTRIEDGRYVVRLPFKELPPTNLGDSKTLALCRLQQMEKRFAYKPDFKQQYSNFMSEYLSHGHMEVIPENELNAKLTKDVYYLPHHAVLRPTSLSTKLRIVFDGSAEPEKGNSINDELLIGPPLQQHIRNLIIKWRQHKICLVADIQKMFRQILVSKDDTDYQRILWRESAKDPLQEYRLLTVTYGTSSAPFLAIRTLHQLAEDERNEFPKEAEILKNDVYMDDLLTGSSTEEEAIVLQKRLTELLGRGGFPLHKWSSNSKVVLNQISNDIKEPQSAVNIIVEDTIKALGITWNSQTDNFELIINLNCDTNIVTKRSVLSIIAKSFDPLGWLAPAIIVLKIFMQKLWLAGLGWDEELPTDLKTEWFTYRENFTQRHIIQFPRWLGISNLTTKMELHGFSDASCAAYAAVIYLRVCNDSEVTVRLVFAKARVAPVKQVTLPRLELCGAVLLAKMLSCVKGLFNIEDENVYAWTDSTIVLAWLRKSPSTWTTFVANRTAEILTVTNSTQWHHIDSANNSADVASRGLSPNNLQQSELWWSGPRFLSNPGIIVNSDPIVHATENELRIKVHSHYCSTEINDTNTYLCKFSSLLKLIRVTAYCLRFIQRCKPRTNKNDFTSYLTSSEMRCALNVCIRWSQAGSFTDEIEALRYNKCIHKRSKLYTLNPYLDDDKLLRVGGRLVNAEVPGYLKSPIILSNNCHLSKLIVSDAHMKTLHGGQQLTLNCVRQRYWIVRLKSLVKTIVRKCITCFKQRAVPQAPFMGDLPDYRVNPDRPFRTSGVDFAGPFTLKLYPGRCKKTCKAYVCLFVCTVTKALHLELVSDLTSAAFLAAFKRFTARRGHCQNIWSDCGTNFVGASRELNLCFKNLKSQVAAEIAELLANDQTTWHFNPPSTPHFGGLWEAGVKSVKGHLKRVIGQTNLTFEEFSTLLTQVEACVNSRPLSPINSSPDEPPLTPGHFLIGNAPIAVTEERLTDIKLSPLDRWRMIQRFVQSLWHRWQLEYLTTLQNRYKWSKIQPDIDLGTIVLVKDDRLPPGKWLLGQVVDKYPGADGTTRVVTLRYKNSLFKRPVTKLCPLPLND